MKNYSLESYYRHHEDRKRRGRERHRLYKEEWKKYLIEKHGENPTCQVCGKSLKWINSGRGNCSVSVNFDHIDGREGSQIKEAPKVWMFKHSPFLQKNIDIWESENFGILCLTCNRRLPDKKEERLALAKYILDNE